jgi:hypothetical protein
VLIVEKVKRSTLLGAVGGNGTQISTVFLQQSKVKIHCHYKNIKLLVLNV